MSSTLAKLRARRAGTSQEGFTLVELLVVVVIIGVLIAIAIPVYLNYTKGSKDKAAQSDLRNAIVVLQQCNADNGGFPVVASAASWTSSVAADTPCTGQQVRISANVTLTYVSTSAAGTAQTTGSVSPSYVLQSSNANGKPTYYCYDSTAGGSVKQQGTTYTGTASCA